MNFCWGHALYASCECIIIYKARMSPQHMFRDAALHAWWCNQITLQKNLWFQCGVVACSVVLVLPNRYINLVVLAAQLITQLDAESVCSTAAEQSVMGSSPVPDQLAQISLHNAPVVHTHHTRPSSPHICSPQDAQCHIHHQCTTQGHPNDHPRVYSVTLCNIHIP